MSIKASDQISIVDVTDAYSVILTSEAFTFVGGTSGAATGLTCTTQAVAYCGTNQCANVQVKANNITCPTGISASVSNSGTSAVTITFTTTATVSNACEAIIPIVVDGITVNKKFSFAVAKQGIQGQVGAAGKSITDVTLHYLATSASTGVTASTTGWTTTIQAVTSTNRYLWTYQSITYSSGSPTTTSPVITGVWGDKGNTGNTGASGVSITGVAMHYLASASSSGVTTSTSGWGTTMPTLTTTNKYLWTYQTVSYSSGNPTNSTPVISGVYGNTGATGAAGADAITMSITSSNGTVFKNSNGSTVLTAHVYKAGVEQTITDAGVCGSLGSVKWYKSGSTTAVATASTLTVAASDVDNAVAYTCQLEA